MIINLLLVLLGFGLIIFGADVLVDGARNIAKKYRIPDVVIGLTIVSIGTSFPEIMITITSARNDYHDLIFGNALGSNIVNLGFILGLIALIKPVYLDRETKNIHLPLAVMATAVLAFMGNGLIGEHLMISKFEGWLLIGMSLIYFIVPAYKSLRRIQLSKHKVRHNTEQISVPKSILFIILGFVTLKFGADFAVNSATHIGEQLGVPESIIGLTVVGMGTALPELITSITATLKGTEGLAIGNLIGSCILNLFLIIGIGAVISPLNYLPVFNLELMFLFGLTFVIWIFSYIGKRNTLSRLEGSLLIGSFIGYMIVLLS
ncbi:MAG: sodium:calcium antiporter [Streptococcaceae bacterium]|jgi:cation:H+ antiporter|nr:sodium:calcium antiporter [Streptococcaceae bacterium]